MEHWTVLLDMIIWPQYHHPSVYDIYVIVDAADEVSAFLCSKAAYYPYMLLVLIWPMKTYFNESFWKVFLRPHPIRCPHLLPLVQTLTMVHFRSSSVEIISCYWDTGRPPPSVHHASKDPPPPPPKWCIHTRRKVAWGFKENQVVEIKLDPNPHIKMGTGLKIFQSMDMTSDTSGENVPHTDDGRQLCLSFHLKGMYSSNCGGLPADQKLITYKHILIAA